MLRKPIQALKKIIKSRLAKESSLFKKIRMLVRILRKIHWLVRKEIPVKLHLLRYEILYPFYKKKFKPTAEHQAFSLTATQIYGTGRTPGVSGYYRIYNEEDFLEASVESHLPFFDELILVHDRTVTDKTPQIAQALADKYPDKIKYYIYQPEAFKLYRSDNAYKILPPNHPHSFVNYYNFALSKTTKQIVAKVDGDHIAIKPMFEKAMLDVHNQDFMQDTFYNFCGLNLWLHEGKIYVDLLEIPGLVGDHGFHLMRLEKRYYTKGILFEVGGFSANNRQYKRAGILYFHLKNMRSEISYDSYRGADVELYKKQFQQQKLKIQENWVDWTTFVNQYRELIQQKTTTDIAELPDPNIYLQDLINSLKPKIT